MHRASAPVWHMFSISVFSPSNMLVFCFCLQIVFLAMPESTALLHLSNHLLPIPWALCLPLTYTRLWSLSSKPTRCWHETIDSVLTLEAGWFCMDYGSWLHSLGGLCCFLCGKALIFLQLLAAGCFLWQRMGKCITQDAEPQKLPCLNEVKDWRPNR